jgi:diamine N-acetyltransferase
VENRTCIIIQPITEPDIPVLSRISAAAYMDHFKYLWFDEGKWYVEKCFSEEALRKEYALKGNQFFLILLNSEPVGFLKLRILSRNVCENCLELERIYLMKNQAGMGIGKFCMNWFEELARKQGFSKLMLKAMDSSTDSIAFYKKKGFKTCGETRLDFQMMKEEWRGMLIMEKNIR